MQTRRLFRSWALVVVIVLVGAAVLGGGGTRNARAVTTSGGPVDFGMSVIAVNITQIGVAQTNDWLTPNYLLGWTIRDFVNTSVPRASGWVKAGYSWTGCSSSGTPCQDPSFDLAFPVTDLVALDMTLWDDQGVFGNSSVNLYGTSNTWTLSFQSSRHGELTQVSYSRTGTTCNPNCKAGTVSLDVTVHGLFHYQTNNRYFWYKSWQTLADYLNDASVTDYCMSQYTFTPQQQKAMLAAFIFSAFLLPFAAYGTTLESELVRTLVDFIIHGEQMAWERYVDSLGTYAGDSFQMAQLRSLFPAQASSCNTWTVWRIMGGAWGTTIRNRMVWIEADLVTVNSKMWANNVPEIINALNTAATEIGGARADTQSMMAAMNNTCRLGGCNMQAVIDAENSVLMPLLRYLQSDLLYTSGLVTSLTAGGSGMRINGQLASYYATYGYALPSVYVNTAYDAGLTVAYGMPPQAYSWSLVSGSPPSGMWFGASGCAAWDFCGKTTTPGTYTFRATLTDGAGDVVTIPFTLVVNVHTYTLTLSTATSGGTTSPAPGTYTFTEGTQVTVTAMPNAGVPFRKWRLDGGDQVANPITVTMNGPHTLAAYFGYTLTIATYGPGTTSPAAGTYYYLPGTNVRVTATPNGGVTFRQWTLDGAAQSANPITVTMNADHALNAYFGKKLTISKTGIGGTVPGSGTIYYADGTQVTITENTVDPYFFKWWTVDGVQNTNDPLTVTMNADHTVVAVFGKPAGGCVAQGTMVTLADGSTRAVEKIKAGDWILGYDLSTGAFVEETVLSTTKTKVDGILSINGDALRVTPTDQPIFVRNATFEGWVRDPQEIRIGSEVFNPVTHTWIVVNSLEYVAGPIWVYDFLTTGPRTYLANSILVMDKPI